MVTTDPWLVRLTDIQNHIKKQHSFSIGFSSLPLTTKMDCKGENRANGAQKLARDKSKDFHGHSSPMIKETLASPDQAPSSYRGIRK